MRLRSPSSRRPTHRPTTPRRERYDARLAAAIEAKWQDRWETEHTFWAPNPDGPLARGLRAVADREKLFVLDMFPYPSGNGLHVGTRSATSAPTSSPGSSG